MHLATYLGLLHTGENTLADSYELVAAGHGDEPEISQISSLLARRCREHAQALAPIVARYGEEAESEPDRLHAATMPAARQGAVGLLRDLQDLLLVATLIDSSWSVVCQAAQAMRDQELLTVVRKVQPQIAEQIAWLTTQIKNAAPQALLVAA